MTVGRTRCRRAFDIDLVAFVHDARGSRWADFREHYPLCTDCSVEVRTWTELKAVLQGGAPPATAHPSPDDLLRLEGGGSALEPDYRRVVEYHVASCRPCADEIATLRAFDFTSLDAVAPTCADALGAEEARDSEVEADPRVADTTEHGPDVEAVDVGTLEHTAADGAVAAEPESGVQVLLEAGLEAEAEVGSEAGVPAVEEGSDALAAAAVPGGGFLPPEALVEGYDDAEGEPTVARGAAPGLARSVAQTMRHPAAGVFLVAALLLPVLWVGELPRFPFGAPARRVGYELPDARVAVATVDDVLEGEPPSDNLAIEFPSSLSGIEEEPLPPPEGGAEVQVALARDDGDVLTDAPGLVVPDEVEDAADATDPWALTRLDDAGPVEIVATSLAAGLELEVPVPLTVPAGAVLQVQIRGEGAREIVERLSFPGARQVALRVPAAWLVPGTYQVDVGVVRRGPAPVKVASYELVVH